MADGQVVFEITGDSKGIKTTISQVTDDIQQESKKWEQATDNATEQMANSFSGMLTKVTGMIAAAGIGKAILDFGKSAIEAASDLAEVQNVVDTVFGDGASQIETWAQTAGEKFGLSETMAKRFTSTLGAMMKSAGMTGNEIVTMSTDLAGLAADMASFYNLDFDTAFQKIRSGISGETEPLKQLGINMSVANLNAFALAQGLEKTFDKMDQGEQTMLRYQYLMQATADAQGDFERTSDGFANAQRKIESSIESIKTSLGNIFLPAIENALAGVSNFLSGISAAMMPEKTIIDQFNEAEINTADKMAEIEKTYNSASDLIKILDEIQTKTTTLKNGGTISYGELFQGIGEVEKTGGDIREYLAGLVDDVDDVVNKYNQWKEVTNQLTGLIPGIATEIDKETGAISDNTDELQKNLDAWRKNEENKVLWAEYYAKAEAVARAKGEQAGIQIEARARQLAAEREAKKLAETYGTVFDEQGRILDRFTGDHKYEYEAGLLNVAEVENQFDNYNNLLDQADQAQKKADKSAGDLSEAEGLLADELQAVQEMTGQTAEEFNNAADAAENYKGKSAETWQSDLKGAKDAAAAIGEVVKYYEKARQATEKSMEKSLGGFGAVDRALDKEKKKLEEYSEEFRKKQEEYNKKGLLKGYVDKSGNVDLEKMSQNYDKLSDNAKKAYNELAKIRNKQTEVNEAINEYSAEGIKKNLRDQITYMQEYLDNLKQLKAWGVSDAMLAQLSDGSKESAQFLQGIIEGGEGSAKEIDKLFQDVEKQKKSFTDELTQQQLTVDEAYNKLVEKAQKTMSDLNLGQEAKNAMGATVLGIADGIRSNVSEVSAAVTELMKALDPLTKFGFSWGYQNGNFVLNLDGSNEKGLDYVPFDGYLSELHEGEGILTAEENRIWQRFKNGQASQANVDYDALGSAMRDNIHAGGNVYLDGKTVGRVVSGIQGDQYRSLQRSGWQQ